MRIFWNCHKVCSDNFKSTRWFQIYLTEVGLKSCKQRSSFSGEYNRFRSQKDWQSNSTDHEKVLINLQVESISLFIISFTAIAMRQAMTPILTTHVKIAALVYQAAISLWRDLAVLSFPSSEKGKTFDETEVPPGLCRDNLLSDLHFLPRSREQRSRARGSRYAIFSQAVCAIDIWSGSCGLLKRWKQ